MLLPGPDHPITITKYPRTVRVVFNGKIVAESANVMKLQEADYRPVLYIPRDDARMEYFRPSGKAYRCPYKGGAIYFSLEVDDKRSEDAAWSFDRPNPVAAVIDMYLAFYPDRVDSISEL